MVLNSLRENALNVVFLSCLLIFFSSLPAYAEPRVLNLDQLIEMSLQTSPELMMAEQDILIAKSDLRQARGGMLPQLDLLGTTGPVQDAKVPIVRSVVKPDGSIVGHLVDEDKHGINIFGRLDMAIEQPLYTFGKISNRKDAALLGVEVQQAAREKKRNEIVLNVKELYFAYLVAGQGKSAAREANDFLDDARKRIKKLVELKAQNADQTDLYRLEAFSAEIKAFEAKAESGSRLAYAALKKAAGLPDNEEIKLDVKEMPKKPVDLEAEGEYIARALAQRPEITEVKKGSEAKKKLAQAAEADLYPSFFTAVIASVAGAPDRQKFDNSYISDEFNHAYGGIVAGAKWHFDFGIGKGKLDGAMAEYQKLRHAREFAEKNIPLEVMKDYEDVVEAQKSYKAYEEAAIGSRRWIVTAFTNFDVGVGTARDIFDAIDRYGKNQGEYLRSLYNYNVALARLDYAIGQRSMTK